MSSPEKINSEKLQNPLITLEGDTVNCRTFKLSISRKHRILLLLDLANIVMCSLLGGFWLKESLLGKGSLNWFYMGLMLTVGILSLLKTIVDFRNWMFTMNTFLNWCGERYVEDVVGIVNGILNAAGKVVQEKVAKAKENPDATQNEQEKKDSETVEP